MVRCCFLEPIFHILTSSVSSSYQGSLEAWLLLRSLRTLHLRVPRQSQNASQLAEWLERVSHTPTGETWDGVQGGFIDTVWHSSIQAKTAGWDIGRQMEGGWNATFSILVSSVGWLIQW